MEAMLSAHAHPRSDMEDMLRRAGWGPPSAALYPDGDDATFRALFPDQAHYDAIFQDLVPVVWRLTRQAHRMV
jgi:hypothetical protein